MRKAKTNQRRTTVRNDPEVQRALNMYQLGLPRVPLAGRSGELLGRGTGSSLEFQEYREYQPGDDIRHLDWAAYGRSDALMIRLFREEISPYTEILLDASKSMGSGESAKPLAARQLTAMFALMSGRLGGRPLIRLLNDAQPLPKWGLTELDSLAEFPFDGVLTLAELCEQRRIPAGRQSIRIVISDFLFPHDAGSLIRQLAAGCSTLWVIQLLTAWEAAPTPVGSRRLIDLETAQQTELRIEQASIAAYLERLKRLQQELETNCRRVHAPFVSLVADRGLAQLCRGELSQVGMLRSD